MKPFQKYGITHCLHLGPTKHSRTSVTKMSLVLQRKKTTPLRADYQLLRLLILRKRQRSAEKSFSLSRHFFSRLWLSPRRQFFFPWEIIVIKIKENEKGLTQSYSTNEGSKSIKSSQAHQQHLQFISLYIIKFFSLLRKTSLHAIWSHFCFFS